MDGIVSKVSFTQFVGVVVPAFVAADTVELFADTFPAASFAFTEKREVVEGFNPVTVVDVEVTLDFKLPFI